MLASEVLAPPVGYSQWLLVLAIALVVVVIAFYAWLLWRPREPAAAPERLSRAHALAAIDSVAGRVRAGTLDSRAAHQELATVVRAFVGADSMTLHELEAAGSPLAPVIREWYPPEFGIAAVGDPLQAVAAARQLVASWS